MLGQIRQDQVGADRRHLVQPGFAVLALDVVFLGEAEAAMGLDADIRRLEGSVGGEHLRHVRLGARILPGLVEPQRLLHHELGRAHVGVGAGDRELHALVLADRPVEQLALLGISRGLLDEPFGVTEPTSGSDTLNLRTTAVREGDHYIINGQKIWTSRAEHSDLLLLIARTTPREQAKTRTGGLSVFLVDMRLAQGSTGISINPIRTMMNHATTELFFDDLRVPADNLIGEEGQGFRYILSGMNAERILIAAECIGDAKWFIAKATGYAKERTVFGRPIGQNQGVQFPIARCYAQMRAAELMVREAASLYEAGRDCGAEANMAKLLAADASWAAADMCLQTHGGFGFAEEFDIERKFRETRLYQVAPISTNLIYAYVAEHLLGLPRSF